MIKANPSGGYITSWVATDPVTGNRSEIFYQGSSLKRTGIPPLFPCWNESGTVLRKHGFARDVEWKTKKLTDEEVIMTLDSRDIKDILDKEYPKVFSVEINASSKKNIFLYSMIVENRGNEDMEIAPAIHPYFNISHSHKNQIKTEGIEGFDPAFFDWDAAPPDNDYPFSRHAKIITPVWTLQIEDVTQSPVFKHMVVWSQPKTADDFNFICFEPLTGLQGAIKKREILIPSLKSWRMDLRFTVSIG